MEITGISPFSGKKIVLKTSGSRITEALRTDGETPVNTLKSRSLISPGMMDIQVNGYSGLDYSDEKFEAEHINSIIMHLAAAGTTQHLPTIITSPQNRILRNLEIIRETRKQDELVHAAIPGIHMEGPYISGTDGPRGAHDRAFVRKPDINEFHEWQNAAGNLIAIVTLAPEVPGAIPYIEKLAGSGVIVAIGHSEAPPDIIRRAISAGARLSTHLGNGTSPLVPRLHNFLWPQLASDILHASIISDSHHLPPEVLQVFTRVKGLDRLILVSDVSPLAGFPPGKYKWGNIQAEVFQDGHLGLPGTEILAGAAHLLDWNVVHFSRSTGNTLGDTLKLCTENPARFLGLEHPSADFSSGEPAHVTIFKYREDLNRLGIVRTIIGGRTVFEAPG